MAFRGNPIRDLKNSIVSAVQSYSGSSADFETTFRNEEAGKISYEYFLAKVDPKQVIVRDTKEWKEAQWRIWVPVIYVDCSKIEQHQIIHRSDRSSSINEVLEKVIEEHTKMYENGTDSYPARYGTDPRLFLIVLLPFKITIGPKWATAILPPTCSEQYKSKLGLGLDDEDMALVTHTIDLGDENHSSRVEWESEWIEWRARTARRPQSTLKKAFSKIMNKFKKGGTYLTHKDK
ncbi:hypothetical protein F5Y13DRAFT_204829, partial [Hypoxylon sp. FL1857]